MCVALLVLAGTAFADPSSGDGAAPTQLIEPGLGEFRGPRDPIELEVGDGLPLSSLVFAEIDDVDVTSFLVFEGNRAVVRLTVPLEPGEHRLRLVEHRPDGSVLERGVFAFQVRQTRAFDVARADVNGGFTASQRLVEDDTPNLPARAHFGGAGAFTGIVEGEDFRASTLADLYYDRTAQNLGGRTFEIGNFLAEASRGPAQLRVGHQRVGPETLVMHDFRRRGASLTLRSEALRSEVIGFALGGDDTYGFERGLGFSDSDLRVTGLQLGSTPVEWETGGLDLTGVFVTGETTDSGSQLAAILGDPSSSDGTAWAGRADLRILDERLRLFGEYALSRFDFDGDRATGSQNDRAHWVGAVVRPVPELELGQRPADLRFELGRSRIGTFFRSPAAPWAAQDRDTRNLRADFRWAGLALESLVSREDDNVGDFANLPTHRATLGWVQASFSPAVLLGGERRGVLAWLGMPTLEGSVSRERFRPRAVPAALAGLPILRDTRTTTTAGGLRFDYDRWGWAARHTRIHQNQLQSGFSSLRTDLTELSAYLFFWERLTLSPRLQIDRTRPNRTLPNLSGGTHASYLAGMDALIQVIPGKLDVSIYPSLERSRIPGLADRRSWIVSGGVHYQVAEARANRPGARVSLMGTYQDLDEDRLVRREGDAYQLFVQATLEWASLWGGD